MINGLDIYYSKKIGQGLRPVTTKKQTQKANGLKPISTKGGSCKKIHGKGLKILQ